MTKRGEGALVLLLKHKVTESKNPWGSLKNIFQPASSNHKHRNSTQESEQSFFKSHVCFCTGNTLVIRRRVCVCMLGEGGNQSLAITSQTAHISTLTVSTEKFEKVWCKKNIKRNNARHLGSLLASQIPVKTKEGLLKSLYNWFHPEVTQGNRLPPQMRTLKPSVKRACFSLCSPLHLSFIEAFVPECK